jgi:hypothetical protein
MSQRPATPIVDNDEVDVIGACSYLHVIQVTCHATQ